MSVFRPIRNFFTYLEMTVIVEGLQILAHTGHVWSLSSKGSLACHTHCDMEQDLIMFIQWRYAYLIHFSDTILYGIPMVCYFYAML